MAQLSIPDIIKVGDISTYLSGNYIDRGKAFGDRLSQDMNVTIAMITDALRWQWAAFPDVPEVRAVGRVTIDSVGDIGDIIALYVNDPTYGPIQIGTYTITIADTTTQIIANGFGLACQQNTYGYQITLSNSNYFQITGREGSGALINNANNLYLVITPSPVEFISSEDDFRLTTQQNVPIQFITTENY